MNLHPPFIITSRLVPGVRIADAVLSLVEIEPGSERDRAFFMIDFDDGSAYVDREMQSGCLGFGSTVEIFATFLSFLLAAAETRNGGKDALMFMPHITEWARDNTSAIEGVWMDLRTEDCDHVNTNLIEE